MWEIYGFQSQEEYVRYLCDVADDRERIEWEMKFYERWTENPWVITNDEYL